MRILSIAALAASLSLVAVPVFAHAGISPKAVSNGQTIKVTVTIPHGCDGAPTDSVTIRLPEGLVNAKPFMKAGWQIETQKGDYARAYDDHGTPVTSGLLEVKWTGGTVPDDMVDEFSVQGSVQGFDGEGVLAFAVTQHCGTDAVAWDEMAGEGVDPHSLAQPAPTIIVGAASGDAHAGHGGGAIGAPVTLGGLSISGGFSRATLPNAPVAGGYLTIVNAGAADRLVSVATPAAGVAQLHEMSMDGGMMKMAELPGGIEIPAGATVELKPGGLHMMFMELTQPMVEGATVPVTLTFETAGTVEVELVVGARDATGVEHTHEGDK